MADRKNGNWELGVGSWGKEDGEMGGKEFRVPRGKRVLSRKCCCFSFRVAVC
uniref:Uncharacterized protein n=1 Tax=Desertifilum tharense IPPAS B-1220 TaxID=1781255 RepID=A0ACD5H163_9CYAN